MLAVVGQNVPGIELATGVVPTYPRHPIMLAAQALTVQAATGGRLTLGIGLSHQIVIENVFGQSFDRPLRHMREYLSILLPLLRGEAVVVPGRDAVGHDVGPARDRRPGPAGRRRRPRSQHARAGGHGGRRHRHVDDRPRDRARPRRPHDHCRRRGRRPTRAAGGRRPAGVRHRRRRRRSGHRRRGVRDLRHAAVVPGDARPRGARRARATWRSWGTRRPSPNRSPRWTSPAPPSSWGRSTAIPQSATAPSRCSRALAKEAR